MLAGRLGPDGAARGEAWVRWVDAGEVVTAGGLSSGIAMALHLVDRFAGRELAVRTARQIEYDWDPESTADPPGEHEQPVKSRQATGKPSGEPEARW